MKAHMNALLMVFALAGCATACTDGPTSPLGNREPAGPGVDRPGPRTGPGVPFDGTLDQSEARTPGPTSGWTSTDVVTFADPSYVVGMSRIKRGPGHASVILEASELEPGTAATLWAVVFNNAAACVGECDDPDLFENAATQADLMYVGGAIADERGRVRYAGRLGEGATDASIMPLFGLPAWGVLEASTAEIHLVVRTHGQAIPGLVSAQTSTFNGGCTGFGAEFGAPGPNECLEPYYASHFAN